MKKSNEYQQVLSPEFFDKCPKAVFAALAVSFGTNGGDYLEEAEQRLLDEWQILYDHGIVPQKPWRKV